MFQSMTGYGSGKVSHKGFEILCEIKSVNNRFVDISFRGFTLPNDFEEYVKIQIKKKFLRGSFEVKINDNFYLSYIDRDGSFIKASFFKLSRFLKCIIRGL